MKQTSELCYENLKSNGFDKVHILRLDVSSAYRDIPADSGYAAIFRDTVSIKYRNLIKIAKAFVNEIAI
jgi:hypothetical protein